MKDVRFQIFGKDKSKAAFDSAGKRSEALKSTLLKVGGAAAGFFAVKGSIDAVTAAAKESISLAGIQEAAEAKLAAVLRTTGQAAGYNLSQLQAMAGSMQQVTTVGDEVILNGQAILATFKQVRGEAFERATAAALDMSQVMGQDLNSSMVQLGKALNDPTKGLSALTRVGVTFTDQQKEQIKVLQESGDLYGAQAIMLAELESEFGGAATAAAQTFGGKVQQLQNNFGDLKEEIGFVITKNQFLADVVDLASGKIMGATGSVKDNRQALMAMTKDGVLWMVDAIILIVDNLRYFQLGWHGVKLAGSLAINALAIGVDGLFKSLRQLLKPLDLIFEGAVKLGALDVNPFDKMESGLGNFVKASLLMTDDILGDIDKVNTGYDSTIAKLKTLRTQIAGMAPKELEGPGDGSKTAGGGTGETGPTKAEVAAQSALERQLQTKLDAMRESYLTEKELLQENLEDKQDLIQQFEDEQLVTEQEGLSLRFEAQIEYNTKLRNLREKEKKQAQKDLTERQKFEAMSYKDRTAYITGQLEAVTAAGAKNNKALFIINKLAAGANAIINTAEGVTAALSLGPWGIPLAAVIAASGAAQIATIAGTTFEGGGSGGASTPSGSGSTTTGSDLRLEPVQTLSEQSQNTTRGIVIEINNYGTVVDSDKYARDMRSSIDKAISDGAL